MQRIVKQDFQLQTCKRVSLIGQVINENCKLKRLLQSQHLLDRFPNERSVRSIWFTAEKIFTLATPVNSQNDRVNSEARKKKQVPVSLGFRSPIKWSGWANKSIRPDHNIPFERIPLKLKIDTKHRLLMLNTCYVDEYFQNTPADLRHYLQRPLLVHGPQI